MSRDLETNLRQKIQELVTRDFAGLELARVALVLENLSVDYEQRARSERSSPGARSSVSEPFRAGGDHSTTTALHRPSEVVATSAPEIAIVAEDEHQVANLLHQIVNIGALMMQVDQPVKLNAFVRLVVEYEPLAFSMHITGRVVNISTRGTAIEIMKLEREDRAALEALYKDYQHLVGVEPGQEGAAQQKSASRAQVSRSGEHHSATHRSGEHPNPMSRLGSTMDGARFAMRRQVAITKPDEAVLKTSTNADVYACKTVAQTTPQHIVRVMSPLFSDQLRKRPEEEVRELAKLFVETGKEPAVKVLSELVHRRGLTTSEQERELAVTIARALIRSPQPSVIAMLDAVAKDWLVPQRIRSTCKEIGDMLRTGS